MLEPKKKRKVVDKINDAMVFGDFFLIMFNFIKSLFR